MIRYALQCDAGHEFEGWFGSSADYDEQVEQGRVSCPVCNTSKVRKQVMAPAISGAKKSGSDAEMRQKMEALRRHVEANFEDVGDDFAREARAIHSGEAQERGIYGQASGKELGELLEDGVPVAPLPPSKKSLN